MDINSEAKLSTGHQRARTTCCCGTTQFALARPPVPFHINTAVVVAGNMSHYWSLPLVSWDTHYELARQTPRILQHFALKGTKERVAALPTFPRYLSTSVLDLRV